MRFVLVHKTARERAKAAIDDAPDGYVALIDEDKRNKNQNAAQWPLLHCFSEQLMWPVNGEMVWLSAEEWKDILSAAFKQEKARIAAGIDGGMVLLGQRTKEFKKKEFSEWLEFLNATAAQRGVDVTHKRER